MSFKLALLFVVCFLALAGAIPVEKPEEAEDTKEAPVAAEPEKEAAEETSDPEEKEEDDSPSEDQEAEQEQDENDDDEKQDEENPEADEAEEEPENEVEAKENDENDPTPGRYKSYHPKCKYVRKKVRRCGKKLVCRGSFYSRRGRCCRKIRYCRYLWIKVRICQVCKRKCRRVCGYRRRKVCQPVLKCKWKRRRVHIGGYHYRYVRYRYCKYVTKCRWLKYKFCQIKCYGYICRYPPYG